MEIKLLIKYNTNVSDNSYYTSSNSSLMLTLVVKIDNQNVIVYQTQ